MRMLVVFSLALLLVIDIGCSRSPCDPLASAERELEAARAVGVPEYLPDEFTALEASLGQIRRDIDRENEKLALFRDHQSAARDEASMEAEVSRLIAATEEKKQRARALALEALERARISVQDTHALASRTAHRALRGPAEAVKEDCLMMMDALARVEGVIAAGDYNAAVLKAEVIEEASHVLTQAIRTASSAIDAGSGRRKSAHTVTRTAPTAG